ncbi:MAG: hypothetical protein EOP84_29175 [Verrucomicrobiaceae bacterium]|nr:MAG: hypothetical protein EOP84_29175 [Verrucomicrobiaceae bacterium]
MKPDRFVLSDKIWVVTEPVGVPAYDFDFRGFFDCRTPFAPSSRSLGVARVGPLPEYEAFFKQCLDSGIRLIHSPKEHDMNAAPILRSGTR